ncbi:30S ribosomal protein S20 [Anatilimnocola sp. NA78]|uniref:30S ribosomal protein S20 n=1 Tax=Anatilimnocola sp. NA78 TaxID=3415683 RepID=UPI003CE4DC9B
MPHTSSAKKRQRQNLKRRATNRATKSLLKTQVRKVTAAATAGDLTAAATEFKTAAQKLDRAAVKGVIHKNAASRKKSRLAAALKKAAGKTK